MNKPKLFCLTDDTGLARHWRASLNEHYELAAGLPAGSGELLLLDVLHPKFGELSALAASQQLIVTSTTPHDEEALAVLRAGARGYCHAAAPAALLQQVLAVVAVGEIWAGRSVMLRLLGALQQLAPAVRAPAVALERLSARELDVARCAAQGKANKEIARELGITERTVKAHLSACFEKLGCADRVQLALQLNGVLPAR